jgi:hypothetical protein
VLITGEGGVNGKRISEGRSRIHEGQETNKTPKQTPKMREQFSEPDPQYQIQIQITLGDAKMNGSMAYRTSSFTASVVSDAPH